MRRKNILFILISLFFCYQPLIGHAATDKVSFFDQGWYHLKQKNLELSISAWQEFINQLPPMQPITFLGKHSDISDALEQLKRAGKERGAMLIVKQQKRTQVYYVLSTQYIHDSSISESSNTAYSARRFQEGNFNLAISRNSNNIPGVNVSPSDSAQFENVRDNIPDNSSENLTTSWIDEGWNELTNRNRSEALNTWQSGVNNLSDTQLLIYIGVYRRLNDAIRMGKRAGHKQQQVIIVKKDFKGAPGYYVLSAQSVPHNTQARRQKLSTLREAVHASGWLYGNDAKKYKTY